MALLECRDLCLGYGGKVFVKDINFEVEKGDYLCIVGENGSGKSTLMKTILKLLQPVSGKINFGDGLLQTQIGYLPQQTVVQKDFPASVYEVVISGCQSRAGMRPFYNKKEKLLAYKNMELLKISDLAKKCYRELSGGQQQRVLLARALCAGKSLLLLDEPVTGLDPNSTKEMYSIIEGLNESESIAVIMISHDVTAAVRYASHILHLGSKVFFGTKGEYIKSSLGSLYLSNESMMKEEESYGNF